MKNIWLLTKMPDQTNIPLLKRLTGQHDAVVCIQDGAYFLRQETAGWPCPLYATRDDLDARGIQTPHAAITYAELIDLIFQAEKVISI